MECKNFNQGMCSIFKGACPYYSEDYRTKCNQFEEGTSFVKPKAKLIGADGNVFNLMGICSRALRRAGYPEKDQEMVDRITKGEDVDYYKALAIMQEYVEVE